MAKRLVTKKQLGDFLADQGQRVSVDEKRYEEVVEYLEGSVLDKFALDLAPASALDAFLQWRGTKYGHSREMPKGRKDGLVQPFKLDGHELVDYAKPIDTETGKASGISATLLWSKRVYKDGYTPPLALRKKVKNYDEAKEQVGRAAKGMERLLKTGAAVHLRRDDLRGLYTQNKWGRFIWPRKNSVEAGTALPSTGPAIDDKLLNMLLNFFGDAPVLHSITFPKVVIKGSHSEFRWLLAGPARVARIVRTVE